MAYRGGAPINIHKFIRLENFQKELGDAWEDLELDLYVEGIVRAIPDWTEKETN
jgi:hypothetical protein